MNHGYSTNILTICDVFFLVFLSNCCYTGFSYLVSGSLCSRLFWLAVVLASGTGAAYFSFSIFSNWHGNRTVTSLQSAASSTSSVAFPAVTICTEGQNLNAIRAALEQDQREWAENRGREKASVRRKRQVDLDPDYLESVFGSRDFPAMEVMNGMGTSAPDPGSVINSAGLQSFSSTCLGDKQGDPLCSKVGEMLIREV